MPKARGAKRGIQAKGDTTTVKVTIDAARKKRFEGLLHEMQSSKREEASGYDAYWEAVGEILQGELYIAGGYATADAFVRAVIKVPLRSVLRNVRVARHASPAEEATFGTALLDAALAYIEAKTGGPVDGPLPIAFEKLRIPLASKDGPKTILLANAIVDQVRAATRALLDKGKKTSSRRPPAEQSISDALRTIKALHDVPVSVRDGKVRIGAFPLNALADVARALSMVKLKPIETGTAKSKKSEGKNAAKTAATSAAKAPSKASARAKSKGA